MDKPRLPDGLPTPTWADEEFGIALYHGDCLDILPTLPKVDCVVTDPPYNVKKDYGTYKDNLPLEEYAAWCARVVGLCKDLAENQFWVAPRYKMALWTSLLPEAHLIVIQRLAYGKIRQGWADQFATALTIGDPRYDVITERMPVGAPPKDLWTEIRLKGEGFLCPDNTYGHPGYTPIGIMARAVSLLSHTSVLDPFLGSGTTGVACVNLGRAFIGIELDKGYFDICVERISKAIVEAQGGELFAEHKPKGLFEANP